MWYADISKCVYWLDTQSVKVWGRFDSSDMNSPQLRDIIFRHIVVLPQENCLKPNIQNYISDGLVTDK